MRFFPPAIAAFRNFCTKRLPNKFKSKYRNPKTRINWTDEQKQILSAVSNGKSVFITGSAGTGKTILLKRIVSLLREYHGSPHVFVTASTGVAACAIRGQTLHSFAGIGINKANRETLPDWILKNRKTHHRWLTAHALVIDEISMIGAELFENLEYVARKTRGTSEIWGGIQLVVSGEFFQLPPVCINQQSSLGKEFAFEADCWNISFDSQVELTKVFRQSDSQFVKLLQGVRKGKSDIGELEVLQQTCSIDEPDPSAVQLYPLNEDVRKVNEEKIKNLLSENCESFTYTSLESGNNPWISQLKQGIVPDEITLCKGARVMLIKNLNSRCGLVNGATGTIVGFEEPEEKGVTDICDDGVLPIVKFDSGKVTTVEPEEWNAMDGDQVVASRKQVPLVLAWALSIHKSQGITLDRLQTNLSKAFNYGMVYVALSRVRSLEGLQLSGFDPSKIQAHPKVLEFDRSFNSERQKEAHPKVLEFDRSFDRERQKEAHPKVLEFDRSFDSAPEKEAHPKVLEFDGGFDSERHKEDEGGWYSIEKL